VHLRLKINLTTNGNNFNDFPENGDKKTSPSDGATNLGDRTAISGGVT